MYIQVETNCNDDFNMGDFNDVIHAVASKICRPVSVVKVVFNPNVTMTLPGEQPRVQVTCVYNEGETTEDEHQELIQKMTPGLKSLLQNRWLLNGQPVIIPDNEAQWLEITFVKSQPSQDNNILSYCKQWIYNIAFVLIAFHMLTLLLYKCGLLEEYMEEFKGLSSTSSYDTQFLESKLLKFIIWIFTW